MLKDAHGTRLGLRLCDRASSIAERSVNAVVAERADGREAHAALEDSLRQTRSARRQKQHDGNVPETAACGDTRSPDMED